MTYRVKLQNFEGPLDLLIFLVRKNEIDIQEIPIILITQQYMEYIELMKVLNLDVAGEFLVMASTLMYLKSKALLPKSDDEETIEEEQTLEELKRQLIEYQTYKDAAQRLKEQNILEKDVFARAYFNEPLSNDDQAILHEVSLFELLSAFKEVLDRNDGEKDVFEVTLEHISVKDKISEILHKLQEHQDGLEFESFFSSQPNKSEIVITFLALLELMKLQAIKVYQNISYSRIYIFPVDDEEDKDELSSHET